MNRRDFIQTSSLAAAALALPRWAKGAEGARKPNIIFILSDDVGLGDVHCTGGKYPTPNIDALAQGGTLFQNACATPLCGPTRAQIMTGRYPFRTGMTSNSTGALLKPANEIMIPRVLKAAGYVTAQVGKWSQLPLQPGDWGFDEYFRIQGSGTYWASQGRQNNVNGQAKPIPENRYVPDMMHEFLTDFVTRHKAQPFYVHYAMSHIHGPILRTPDSTPNSDHYADNIAYMDKLVGQLVAELDRLGLRDNTLLIFVGDNGTAQGHAAGSTVNGRAISGMKHTMQEGGVRVPMIANWPGVTPAGKVCPDLTDFSDCLPTFAELAGAPLPAGVTLDGHSILPQIKGQTGQPREWIYVQLEDWRYVRTLRWKLNNAGELFDMKEAPYKEILIAKDSTDPEAIEARRHLQDILDNLVGKNAPPPSGPLALKSAKQRANRRNRAGKNGVAQKKGVRKNGKRRRAGAGQIAA